MISPFFLNLAVDGEEMAGTEKEQSARDITVVFARKSSSGLGLGNNSRLFVREEVYPLGSVLRTSADDAFSCSISM